MKNPISCGLIVNIRCRCLSWCGGSTSHHTGNMQNSCLRHTHTHTHWDNNIKCTTALRERRVWGGWVCWLRRARCVGVDAMRVLRVVNKTDAKRRHAHTKTAGCLFVCQSKQSGERDGCLWCCCCWCCMAGWIFVCVCK